MFRRSQQVLKRRKFCCLLNDFTRFEQSVFTEFGGHQLHAHGQSIYYTRRNRQAWK